MTPISHTFDLIFLHINWHCHRDQAMIRPQMEEGLHRFMQQHCEKTRGVEFKGIGGTETHVHLALQVEPVLCPSEFIGKIKGASAHEMNKRYGRDTLKWQRGYGVVSFAKRNLPAVLRYVADQKKHHREGTLNHTLEASGDLEDGTP
jgi:putative transposase